MNHFKELQNRFFLIILCWVSIFLIVYSYKEIILLEFIKPTVHKSNMVLNNFIFTNVTELFNFYLELSIFLSNQIVTFYTFYHIFLFVVPGLYVYEYYLFKTFFLIITIIWLITTLLYYYYLAPLLWKFFSSFQENLIEQKVNIVFDAKISEYLLFFIQFYYNLNFQFQIFSFLIVILFFTNNYKKLLKSFRKVFYFLFLLVSTVITPPDVFSQLILFFILILFFEFIIIIRFLKLS